MSKPRIPYYNIIGFYNGSEEEVFEKFFELLDKYLEENIKNKECYEAFFSQGRWGL